MNRVVITGLGSITPIGIGKENYWNSLLAGKSGIGYITRFNTENHDTKVAAEINEFNPLDFFEKKEAKRMDRFAQFAVAATKLALEDGKIDLDGLDKDRIGTIIGSGIGGIESLENEVIKYTQKGPNRVSPLFIPMMISNMAAGQISMNFGLTGASMTITTACACNWRII
jgi:3-oxoacyl-[acyl-carrier-protein] synthase II